MFEGEIKMHPFVIIADDFTGANDTGVQIRKAGTPIDVILDAAAIRDDGASLSIDTESRVISGKEAYERVYQAVQQVEATGGCGVLYKKVDSTLRGHLQEEIRAAVAAYAPELILFAPAYPAQGRTVEKGRLCVYGTPLMETEIAADPRNPLTEDRVQVLLEACLQAPVQHISLAEIEGGDVAFTERAYSFNTLEQAQLAALTRKAMQTGKKILWIGSAGLAEGILQARPHRPALAVIGSISSKTMAQLAYCKAQGIPVAALEMKEIYETRQCEAAVRTVVSYLQDGKDVVLTGAACRQDYEDFAAYGREKGISTDELAEFTKQTLSRMVPAILQEAAVSGLFLTGGDTAIAVIQQLQARGSHIEQEIIPGFVEGRLLGGTQDGLPIVTKAGAFGTEQDIYNCIKKLSR